MVQLKVWIWTRAKLSAAQPWHADLSGNAAAIPFEYRKPDLNSNRVFVADSATDRRPLHETYSTRFLAFPLALSAGCFFSDLIALHGRQKQGCLW